MSIIELAFPGALWTWADASSLGWHKIYSRLHMRQKGACRDTQHVEGICLCVHWPHLVCVWCSSERVPSLWSSSCCDFKQQLAHCHRNILNSWLPKTWRWKKRINFCSEQEILAASANALGLFFKGNAPSVCHLLFSKAYQGTCRDFKSLPQNGSFLVSFV